VFTRRASEQAAATLPVTCPASVSVDVILVLLMMHRSLSLQHYKCRVVGMLLVVSVSLDIKYK